MTKLSGGRVSPVGEPSTLAAGWGREGWSFGASAAKRAATQPARTAPALGALVGASPAALALLAEPRGLAIAEGSWAPGGDSATLGALLGRCLAGAVEEALQGMRRAPERVVFAAPRAGARARAFDGFWDAVGRPDGELVDLFDVAPGACRARQVREAGQLLLVEIGEVGVRLAVSGKAALDAPRPLLELEELDGFGVVAVEAALVQALRERGGVPASPAAHAMLAEAVRAMRRDLESTDRAEYPLPFVALGGSSPEPLSLEARELDRALDGTIRALRRGLVRVKGSGVDAVLLYGEGAGLPGVRRTVEDVVDAPLHVLEAPLALGVPIAPRGANLRARTGSPRAGGPATARGTAASRASSRSSRAAPPRHPSSPGMATASRPAPPRRPSSPGAARASRPAPPRHPSSPGMARPSRPAPPRHPSSPGMRSPSAPSSPGAARAPSSSPGGTRPPSRPTSSAGAEAPARPSSASAPPPTTRSDVMPRADRTSPGAPASTHTRKKSAPPGASIAPTAADDGAALAEGVVENPMRALDIADLDLRRVGAPTAVPNLLFGLARARASGVLHVEMEGLEQVEAPFVEGRLLLLPHERTLLVDTHKKRSGAYRFEAGREPDRMHRRERVSPYAVVVEGLRKVAWTFQDGESELAFAARLTQAPLVRRSLKELQARGFSDAEARFAHFSCDGSAALDDLLERAGTGRRTALFTLCMTRVFGLLGWQTPRPRDGEDPAVELRRQLARALKGNHFETLRVHWSANHAEIEAAYRAHVEALSPGGELHAHDPASAERLLARVEEAWAELRDERRRVAHRKEAYPTVHYDGLAELLEQKATALSMRDEVSATQARRRLRELRSTAEARPRRAAGGSRSDES
ncbi:MAG: hypothetical protein CMN29_24495 [Sandaracinus sp.]|nr:hypothetical protein [Sandaracinus sp.]